MHADGAPSWNAIVAVRGPMRGQILDLTYTDATALYGSPPPTWVAGALIEWQPTNAARA